MNFFKRLTLSRQSGWKVAVIGFSVLLVLALLLARAHTASAASSPSGATITSDKQDYQPGATVTLTGAGWAANEAVHIHVSDSDGTTWSFDSNPDPAADGSGGFTYQFSLPSTVIAFYTATATGATSGTATTAFTDSNCPSGGTGNPQTDPNVFASFTTSGKTLTYTFSSVNESPSGGAPGLIDYCVYPTGSSPLLPDSHTVVATGSNSSAWVYDTSSDSFSFARPNGGGTADNIPLNGATVTMGTGTWSGNVPTSQVILLHVDDPAECSALYGSGTLTCFVLPGTPQTAKDLTVSKTATPSFTKTYTWGITKSVAPPTKQTIAVGGTATFNYTVEVTHDSGTDSNWMVTGKITVSNPNGFEDIVANVSDAINNGGICTVTGGTNVTVPAGKSVTLDYSCTYSSAPSPLAGTNTATATWDKATYFTPDGSATGTASADFSKATVTVNNGTITVVDDKTDPAHPVTLGTASYTQTNPIDFTYVLSFSGKSGTCTDYTNTATIKETSQTASQTVTVCAAKVLSVSKTATPTFTRTFKWDIKKSVDQTTQTIAAGGTATFNYTVEVTHDTSTDSGWAVSGKITVSNPNDFEDIVVNVSDTIDNGGICTVTGGSNVTVKAGQSVTLDYSCSYASAPSPLAGTNTATATWDQTAASTQSGTATGTASADFSTTTPTIVDGTITVVDDKTDPSNPVTLGTADYTQANPIDFKYALQKSGVGGTCTSYTNTATFTTDTSGTTGKASQTVTLCVAEDLTVAKNATPSFTRTYTWSIAKSADQPKQTIAAGKTGTFNYTVTVMQTGFTDSGWQVNGTIIVSNPNDFEDIVANVSDAVVNGGSCTVTGGSNVTVPHSGSVKLDYSCTYSSAPTSISSTNTATASWDQAKASTPNSSAQGSATFAFATPTTKVNQTITVTDSYKGTLGTATATDTPPFTLQPFTYSRTESGTPGTCTTYPNTATIVETGQSASASVQLCVAKDLQVTKDANPSFTRTYNWSIAKVVDKTLVEQLGGGTATFNYTVTVNETGFTDPGWKVIGTIIVSNPNDFESITLTGVTDAVNNGGSCNITSGNTTATIVANGIATLGYSCTYSSQPAYNTTVTNTATANWSQTAASTPDGSAQGTKTFAFTTPTTTVNKTVTVTDTFNSVTTTLGTLTATDAKPFASATYKYPRTINVPTSNCVKYTNTAKIVETGQTASQTIEVCGPAKTGALTMGYWQNKNGQGIIAKSGPSSGTCALTTWLRQYAPFQDLSATAPCGSVGSTSSNDVVGYVYNVIKAANASGSSMNAMLKAQMLATALDVYFGGGPGGNPINAPVVIGNVTIDLTSICHMIDGSNSTATCSGSFENVSSAFGGAGSLTVSQMLTYAASQSNAGGSVWYAQVKATQQLAKDAFDAINNQVAFAP
jgi:hypothetical protein